MSTGKRRRTVSQETVDELMFRNRHTCCICHDSSKHVQIHHIDGNPSNNDIDNLAVLCLDCHSRVSGDLGLGRRFTPGEIWKYKREWESLNLSRLESRPVVDEVEAAVIRADMSRLMIEVISLNNTQRQLEALDQIESYYIYLGMQEEALEAIGIGPCQSRRPMVQNCADPAKSTVRGPILATKWGFADLDRA
jgi:hypothetical protein